LSHIQNTTTELLAELPANARGERLRVTVEFVGTRRKLRLRTWVPGPDGHLLAGKDGVTIRREHVVAVIEALIRGASQ
jgi:hypothetical protein